MITDTTTPYEVLIRFDEGGAIQGAHVQRRRRIVYNGEVLRDEILPAEPIDAEGFPLSEIMTDALAAALAENDRLRDRLAALEAQIESPESEAEPQD